MRLEGLGAEERKQKIIDIVETKESVTVPELVDTFCVTGATIRGDLRELESQHKLIRTHGGAVSVSKRYFEDKPEERTHILEKKLIVKKALDYLSDGDSLLIDTGSTAVEFARHVVASGIQDLKIITNDIKVAEIIEECKSASIILVGGMIRKGYHCTFGNQAADQLRRFTVNKAFMASTAFHTVNGFTTPSLHVAEMKQVMISRATQIIMMCDSSKLGKSTLCTFANMGDVDIMITDDKANPEILDQMVNSQIDVVLAEGL